MTVTKSVIEEEVYPVLPLRDMVMFPHMIAPLFIGRERSAKALEASAEQGKILLVAQKDPNKDDPKNKELYKVGVVSNVLQVLRLQDGTIKALVEGFKRVVISKFTTKEGVAYAHCLELEDDVFEETNELKALNRAIVEQFIQYSKLNRKIPADVTSNVAQMSNISKFCDIISSHLTVKMEEKQKILELRDVDKKLEKILFSIESEIEVLETEHKLRVKVRDKIETNQKQYYLNAKLRAIQDELGEGDLHEEINILVSRLAKKKMSKEVRERTESEVRKLKSMNPMSSEATVVRSYIEWIIDLPWSEYTKESKDLRKAQDELNKSHYGLDKVKERIVEYLAVTLRTKVLKSPIICLLGPPGVGKTSMAKSVAESIGRKFVKISLGGLRDEAEIKGHRKTYIGAMPGRIIQAMKKVGVKNPVILLDEIDKMSSDYRGDPASAILDILDPEQNDKFSDHYLEIDYDLSSVMFIATANSLEGMSKPLRDRMEIIKISGYTDKEKMQIAKSYLLPKQLKAHGITQEECLIDQNVVSELIKYYTREAGVRSMDREIAKLCRKAVKKILLEKVESIDVTQENLKDYLGIPRYTFTKIEQEDLIGMVNGLAYTEVGGDVLIIEAVAMAGKGDIRITGQLGKVMEESVHAAMSYIKSRLAQFGIEQSKISTTDIHVHVPEGATPKDGPSAGVTLFTAIVSLLSGIPARKDVGMTGEITLRGRVLEIGGLKEKLLSAMRSGIKTVIIPQENVKDLEDIDKEVIEALSIKPVSYAHEALSIALTKPIGSESA